MVPRTLTAIALVSSFVWFYWFQKQAVGYVSETGNGITHVAASSSPRVVVLSGLGILLYIFLMTRKVRIENIRPSSLELRVLAFVFDCWFLMLAIIGASSLIHLLFEASRSGTFRWYYERQSYAAAEGADTALIPINLTVMFLYFVIPLTRRTQTVGQWVFGLVTVSEGGSLLYVPFTTALWRTFMAFRGLISPWRLLKETDRQGRTWYDRETGLAVVRYQSGSEIPSGPTVTPD